MSLISRLFHKYYSIETKASQDQLRDDFGAFPPLPLRCECLGGEFDLIRARGLGEVWQMIRTMKELLHPSRDQAQELSPDAAAAVGDAITTMRKVVEQMSRGSEKNAQLITPILLGLAFIVESWRYLRHGPRMNGPLGYFMPMRKGESEIVIRTARHGKSKVNVAATIAHEHIHLLQHRRPEVQGRNIKSPELLIEGKVLAGDPATLRFLLYVLSRLEMEARLHELVLSFYRAHQNLPTTVSGFLALLASNTTIGSITSPNLRLMKVPLENLPGEYGEREHEFVSQLELAFLFMKDDMVGKYLVEVLPVMYGNLLKYYGDETTSQRLLSEIRRPNLYDDLY